MPFFVTSAFDMEISDVLPFRWQITSYQTALSPVRLTLIARLGRLNGQL